MLTGLAKDEKLLEGLKNGDKKTIETIYSMAFPLVKNWIINNSGNLEDAYDVFQESLEILLLKIKNVESSLTALILSISKRRWLDKIKRGKVKQKYSDSLSYDEDQVSSIEEGYIQKENEYEKFKLMEITFVQLSDLCQQVLSLIKQGEDVNSIVAKLNLNSSNTLYRRKAACIEKWSGLVRANPMYKELSYE